MSNKLFTDFGLSSDLLKGIEEAGFEKPSPIQAQTLPLILSGKDIIAQAHTGTGKTAAFGLGAMHQIEKGAGLQILVIAPTRELSNQVCKELDRLGKFTGLRSVTISGGHSYRTQLSSLRSGVEVVSSTPGRLLDLLKGGRIKDFRPKIVVLDEADEMLEMGFLEPVQEIFTYLPEERQTLLFSATMPSKISTLAKQILKSPVVVKTVSDKDKTNSSIKQLYCVMNEKERLHSLIRLMQHFNPEKAIIFCRTRIETEQLKSTLRTKGFEARALHGDMEQNQRNITMQDLRNGRSNILVATDVAARGIDLPEVTHVINYHIPYDSNSYVHRVGRTGRGGNEGLAISLVNTREIGTFLRCMREIKATPTFKEIPTLSQVKKRSARRLRKSLVETNAHPGADGLITRLCEIFNKEEACERLASFILNQNKYGGPEYLGVAETDVETLVKRRSSGRRGNASRKGRGNFGRNSGKSSRGNSRRDSSEGDSRSFRKGGPKKSGYSKKRRETGARG